ncbi:hypothetical protein GCM10027033_24650 [Leucobacter ruminantium]
MNVSTKPSERTCFQGIATTAAYCGRRSARIVPISDATCADCHAAHRADEAVAEAREAGAR